MAASADDDYVKRQTSTNWVTNNNVLFVGNFSGTWYGNGSSMRFTGVNIPAAATITVGYLTIIAENSNSGTIVNSDLCAEDANNPTQNSSYADHIGRTRTAAVPWDSIAAWTIGTSYQSPSIVTPVQTVVTNNGGTGDALKIFLEDKDLESSTGAIRQGASWDSTTYAPPAIHLEWTEGGGASPSPSTSRRLVTAGYI